MALSKAEVCRAFRQVMAQDYADIPEKDAIEHVFSPEFYAKMDALIAEQKRGSWRLLKQRVRRTLVVAVILTLSLLLVACTPRLRQAVAELAVTVYETFVRFTSNADGGQPRVEIETAYEFDPAPEGFTLVSQTQSNPFCVETVYMDDAGDRIHLWQAISAGVHGTTDMENASSFAKVIQGTNVWFSAADDLQTATFFYDGYRFAIRYMGEITQTELEALVETFLKH